MAHHQRIKVADRDYHPLCVCKEECHQMLQGLWQMEENLQDTESENQFCE